VVKTLRRLVPAALAVALSLLAAPAHADGDLGSEPPPPTTSDPTTPPVDPPTTGTAGGCSLVAGPRYVGASCGSASNRDGRTVKEILGDDPVPDCWQEPLTQDELDELGYENVPGPDGYTWVWQRCLTGIDKKTKKVEGGGIQITVELMRWPNSRPTTQLTHNQQLLVDYNNTNRTIPAPIAVISPSYRPRVGQTVWFRDGTPSDENDFTVQVGGVTLHPHIVSIDVHPLGYNLGDTFSCDGTGVESQPGWTADDHPECSYRYEHSSAEQQDRTYPVTMVAHWQVDLTVGGQTRVFATFTKSQITAVPVTEIQTVVVP
jgi:hypothetical protein